MLTATEPVAHIAFKAPSSLAEAVDLIAAHLDRGRTKRSALLRKAVAHWIESVAAKAVQDGVVSRAEIQKAVRNAADDSGLGLVRTASTEQGLLAAIKLIVERKEGGVSAG